MMRPGATPFWSAGFRPFFLMGALYAVVALALWISYLAGAFALDGPLAINSLHGHEMIFGFGGAAIGGFILTAMPNWTRTVPLHGFSLMGLFSLWLAGRIAVWSGDLLPPAAIALLDLAFLPALAVITARTLLRAGNTRNLMLPGIFLLLALCNLLFYLGALGVIDLDPRLALEGGIGILLVLISIIGGRIIPAFTRNALARRGIELDVSTPLPLTATAIIGTALMIPGDFLLADRFPLIFGTYCLSLGAVHLLRLCYWQGWRTLHDPLLWSMHLGYLWLPIGLSLKGYGLVTYGYFWEVAIHALTVGAIASTILIVMIRAGLGHSGRPLAATPPMTVALISLSLAAPARVLQPFFDGPLADLLLKGSALLWILAFGLYVAQFTPFMLAPRADGKPG